MSPFWIYQLKVFFGGQKRSLLEVKRDQFKVLIGLHKRSLLELKRDQFMRSQKVRFGGSKGNKRSFLGDIKGPFCRSKRDQFKVLFGGHNRSLLEVQKRPV